METKEQEKTRRKQMLILAALILFGVWFLLLVSINHSHAAIGICKGMTASDANKLYEYGKNVHYCNDRACADKLWDAMTYQEDWIEFEGEDFTLYDGSVQGWRLYRGVTEYATIIFDLVGNAEFIGEGCTAENVMMTNFMSWALYVLTGIMFAWAFVAAISTVNS